MLSKPTLFMGHAGEVAHVDKPSKMPGGMVLNLTFAPVLQNPLQGPDDLERVMIPALTKWFNDERGNLISVIERKIARS
jgi:hypothetical protein